MTKPAPAKFAVTVRAPDGNHKLGTHATFDEARAAARAWLGGSPDREPNETGDGWESYVCDFGSVVTVGPARADGTGKRAHLGWDYAFETGWLVDHLDFGWGYPVTEYDDIDYKNMTASQRAQHELNRTAFLQFLAETLVRLGIEAYADDNAVWESDVVALLDAARAAEATGDLPVGTSAGIEAWQKETFGLDTVADRSGRPRCQRT